MSRRISPALGLAMALAAENVIYPDRETRAEICAVWKAATPEARRHWRKKATRLLDRYDAILEGPL